MEKILVSGHKSPDTDSIVSAIAFAHLLNATGTPAEAVALGTPAEETQFALDHFGFDAPRVIDAIEPGTDLALVDHNEAQQSIPNREAGRIRYVVDHHRIANIETADPLYYRAETVGCTNTILYSLFQEAAVDIPQNLAGLMCSAIISDTLLMKSPTGTARDENAMTALATIAGVDVRGYGMALLKAGTNLSNKSDRALLDTDAKSFTMDAATVRIGQVNTVDLDEVIARRSDLEALMAADNEANQYDLFVLLVTDVLESNSIAFVVGEGTEKMKAAFDTDFEEGIMKLDGVVSRKKQVVPNLTKAYEAQR